LVYVLNDELIAKPLQMNARGKESICVVLREAVSSVTYKATTPHLSAPITIRQTKEDKQLTKGHGFTKAAWWIS